MIVCYNLFYFHMTQWWRSVYRLKGIVENIKIIFKILACIVTFFKKIQNSKICQILLPIDHIVNISLLIVGHKSLSIIDFAAFTIYYKILLYSRLLL